MDAPMSKGVDAHTGNVDVRIEYASYDMLTAGHRLEWKSLRCPSFSSCGTGALCDDHRADNLYFLLTVCGCVSPHGLSRRFGAQNATDRILM
jgi:hypothetical protein